MSKEQDAAFFRTLALVLMSLVVFAVAAAFLGRYLGSMAERDTGDTVAQRIAPVGEVNTDPNAKLTAALPVASPATEVAAAAAPAATAAASGDPGKQTYDTVCFACHAAGVMNAPKFGDKDLWAPRLAKGRDTLYEHALKGFNLMPAKGGNAALSDDVVKAAVDYMASAAGGEARAPAAEQAPPAAPPATAETKATAATNESAPAPAADKGKHIYDTVCFACHAAGVAGAPKFSDKAAWAPRIAQGKDTLYKHALEGFFGKNGLMPPKGGRADLPDEDIKAAVDYMAGAAQ
ncbi:MAG TPA: c-type cytochrome [Gammaproteobacteria bacterium]|nr:c-type cytochrome [Gammaproteobacteria bacterium]